MLVPLTPSVVSNRYGVSSGPVVDEGGWGYSMNFVQTKTVRDAAAMLDCVCDGRLEFGTGRSSLYEQQAFGIHFEESRSMWQEALEVARVTDLYTRKGSVWLRMGSLPRQFYM